MSDPALDAAYDVRATVPPEVFDSVLADYRRRSTEADSLPGARGVLYDEASGERLDVFGASGQETLRPVVVAIHGGYWRLLSRHDTAFMAPPLAAAGVATVAIDYTLAPRASLEEIVRQVRAAVAWVHRRGTAHGLDPERIVVTGSSAGGHLAAMTAVDGWHADAGVPRDVVKAVLPLSGLFDLRPLVRTFANEWLGLDDERAWALSPLSAVHGQRPRMVCAVAEHDGSGFLEQSRAFHAAWSREHRSELVVVPERNHYDVFLDLADPGSRLTTMLLDLVAETA